MTKKVDNRVGKDDKITVLAKNSTTTKRISVVDRGSNYTVHADDTMKDRTKVIKRGKGSGADQVAAYKAKGYGKG